MPLLHYLYRCSPCSGTATWCRVEEITRAGFLTVNHSYLLISATCLFAFLSLLWLQPSSMLFSSFATLSASSIPCHLNVTRILHLQSGFSNPLQEPLFKFQKDPLLCGIKQLHGNAVWHKLPITPDILSKLHATLDFTNSLDATFWAACLIIFFSFFRKSNLLIASVGSFDPQKHLRKCDIRACKWGLLLIVCWSKTIQYCNRT